jgi:hypothetical protein
LIGNIGSAAHDLPPQSQYSLSLYELHDYEHDNDNAKGKLLKSLHGQGQQDFSLASPIDTVAWTLQ